MAAQGLRGWLTGRIEVMTRLPGCVAAAAIGAAIFTAVPGFADGARFAGRHYVGGFHDPACFPHHRHFRKFAFVGGPFFYDYAGYGNYCWQQVWTPSGWQWLDACAGYYGFGY
jgi:hypothetical protein